MMKSPKQLQITEEFGNMEYSKVQECSDAANTGNFSSRKGELSWQNTR